MATIGNDLNTITQLARRGDAVHTRLTRADYRALVLAAQQPPEVAAAVAAVAEQWIARHRTQTAFLSKRSSKSKTADLMSSPRWREADAGVFAGLQVLAAILGVIHPSPDGKPPHVEATALVEAHVGPLCTGWSTREDGVVDAHHPRLPCPVHDTDDD